jgi:hypothetical protein
MERRRWREGDGKKEIEIRRWRERESESGDKEMEIRR